MDFNIKKQQKKYYDELSTSIDGYDYYFTNVLGRITPNIYSFFFTEKLSTLIPNCNILLDVGCGYEPLFELLSNKCNFFIACDISPNSLKILRKKGEKVITILCDVEKIPIKKSVVDFIFSSNLIEHLINQEKFLKDIERVSKKNGCVLIITPNKLGFSEIFLSLTGNYGQFHRNRVGHINLLTLKKIEEIVNKIENFKIQKKTCSGIFPIGGISFPIIGKYLTPSLIINILSMKYFNQMNRYLEFEYKLSQYFKSFSYDIILLIKKI